MHILLTYLISKIVVRQHNHAALRQARVESALARNVEVIAINQCEHGVTVYLYSYSRHEEIETTVFWAGPNLRQAPVAAQIEAGDRRFQSSDIHFERVDRDFFCERQKQKRPT